MTGALLPLWIIGGPFLGILFVSGIYSGGTSASSAVDRRTVPGSRGFAAGTANYSSTGYPARSAQAPRSPTLDLISRLSGPVSPGAISELSGYKSPGAISSLSGWKSPGAISKLSGYKSPGAISRLSGPKSPGAISRLSQPKPVGSIATLSAGFYVSSLFGLPLLTRSQSPSEPDESLLIPERRHGR